MRQLILIVGALALAACGGGDSSADADAAGDNPLGETYLESLDRAEAVQDQVNDSKSRIDEALEEADKGN